ncbi:S8 family serine peptidase [uncultured Polaribacter sp.]|uniref:S8 family serine peptidase n=1 Tax=uncultured Polaribacter sp. TaxID=174711 RepID=UPI00262A4B85|nr:S8 family serine peptidase [uncultured Polaribacter sp.]
MHKIGLLFFLLVSTTFFAQQEDAWVYLKDKPSASNYIENPLTMLSQRAIDRRINLQIELDSVDVPLEKSYYNQIKKANNIIVLGKSKWLNAIHIQGTIAAITELKTDFSFIKHIEFANKSLNTSSKTISKTAMDNHSNKFKNVTKPFNYGAADTQIKMLKGDFLHQQGLTGKNQIIAVMDSGFPNVNTLPAFKRLRDNNQILGGYNFADRNTNFYTRNNHGTNVLSTIGGYIQDEFVGTAPDAKFYLFITEIVESETVLEETLWVEAAEKADSLGVDVINTSLGYSTFDNPNHSYSYQDMDGKTTFISRGAEIASQKGVLVVNSAGNSGNSAWKYITAPADAKSVITVGSVAANRNISFFSSFGPSFDGRIKPEILAMGGASAVIHHISGEVVNFSGTSFSSPIMAGLIACLNDNAGFLLKSSSKTLPKNWNAYLKEAVYTSADRYVNPTAQHGYGIPNFDQALQNYKASTASLLYNNFINLKVFPNPTATIFNVDGLADGLKSYQLELFDVLGKQIKPQINYTINQIDISLLNSGIYFLKITKDNQQKTIKIIKQ